MDVTMLRLELPLVLLLVFISGFTLSEDATTAKPETDQPGEGLPTSTPTAQTSETGKNGISTQEIDTIWTSETSATELVTVSSDDGYSTAPTPTEVPSLNTGDDMSTILATDPGSVDALQGSDSRVSSEESTTGLEDSTMTGSTSLPFTTTFDRGGQPNGTVTANNLENLVVTDRSDGPDTSRIPSQAPTLIRDVKVAVKMRNYTMTLKMSGDCEGIDNQTRFLKELQVKLSDHFASINQGRRFKLHPVQLKCGSIIVELDVEMDPSDKVDFQTSQDFKFTYNSVMYKAEEVTFEGDGGSLATTPVAGIGDSSKTSNPLQETLIYIVIGSVGGSFLLLSLFLLCQYLAHKAIKTSGKNSFRPRADEPSIKLSDFNMAHTYIPRPQSIYSATTRSSFLPYEDMDPGIAYGGVASPTPYVYADGDRIREHYHEVVETKGDPVVTPTTKTSQEFGRSGIPSWDLPILEGVVQEEDSASTLRIDDRPTSSTFLAPPEGIPPPPESNPPPPPGDSHPGQRPQGEEGTTSLKSEDGSSHTELSGGDTRHLIRPQNHDVGVDNPALDIDDAYF